jgi:hypothetical protein
VGNKKKVRTKKEKQKTGSKEPVNKDRNTGSKEPVNKDRKTGSKEPVNKSL